MGPHTTAPLLQTYDEFFGQAQAVLTKIPHTYQAAARGFSSFSYVGIFFYRLCLSGKEATNQTGTPGTV